MLYRNWLGSWSLTLGRRPRSQPLQEQLQDLRKYLSIPHSFVFFLEAHVRVRASAAQAATVPIRVQAALVQALPLLLALAASLARPIHSRLAALLIRASDVVWKCNELPSFVRVHT